LNPVSGALPRRRYADPNTESNCASAGLLQNRRMNLDALYSELTLKPNAKLALVVLDGLGDIATKEQNYLTPLEAATTPNLDKLPRTRRRAA
jgi:hypothetical protein